MSRLAPDQPPTPRDAVVRERLPIEVVLDGAPGADLRWAVGLALPRTAYDRGAGLAGTNVVASRAQGFAEVVLEHLLAQPPEALASWTAFLPADAPARALDLQVRAGQAVDASPGLLGLVVEAITFGADRPFHWLSRRALTSDLLGRPETTALPMEAVQREIFGEVTRSMVWQPGGFLVARDAVIAHFGRLRAARDVLDDLLQPDEVFARLWHRLFT